MTKYTPTWGISYPEGTQKVAVPADVQDNAATTDAALSDAGNQIETDVMAEVDVRLEPVEPLLEIMDQADPVEWDDAVYNAGVFDDDKASFLDVRIDGLPTNFATDSIGRRLDERGWLPEGGGGGGEATPVWARERVNHPTVVKPLDGPILAFGDQPAESILALRFVTDPTTGQLYGTYSTDHGTHATSGFFLLRIGQSGGITARDFLTPSQWVPLGRVFRDDEGGNQTETPYVWWSEPYQKWLCTYQMQNNSNNGGIPEAPPAFNDQLTLIAEADSIEGPWTRIGPVTTAYLERPYIGHTGYVQLDATRAIHQMRALRGEGLAGRLPGGGGASNVDWQVIGDPRDPNNWYQKPVVKGRNTTPSDHYENWNTSWRGNLNDAFQWQGEGWALGVMGAASGSGILTPKMIHVAPVGQPYANPDGSRGFDVTPPAQDWELGGISALFDDIEIEGRYFVTYANMPGSDDQTKSVGVLEVI